MSVVPLFEDKCLYTAQKYAHTITSNSKALDYLHYGRGWTDIVPMHSLLYIIAQWLCTDTRHEMAYLITLLCVFVLCAICNTSVTL